MYNMFLQYLFESTYRIFPKRFDMWFWLIDWFCRGCWQIVCCAIFSSKCFVDKINLASKFQNVLLCDMFPKLKVKIFIWNFDQLFDISCLFMRLTCCALLSFYNFTLHEFDQHFNVHYDFTNLDLEHCFTNLNSRNWESRSVDSIHLNIILQ